MMEQGIEQISILGGHGILEEKDLPSLNDATVRTLNLMLDGQWHSATNILATSGQREGLRRMRTLRNQYIIERQRVGDSRDFWYRLVKKS